MRKTAALVLAVCMLLVLLPPMTAQAATDYGWVRVKLTTNNATTLKFYTSGSYFIEESGAEFKGGTLTVTASGGQMTVTHSSDGLLYTGRTLYIRRASVDRTAGFMQLNSRNYLGHFYLKVTSSGYIQVVNLVPMAHYLYGVVAYEMNNTYPLDALKAQAIAAKGYVMNQMGGSGDYDIGDTSAEQVYKGYNSSYTNVINAVDSTLGEVLTVGNSVLRSYFAASNGGETNLPSYAWSGRSNGGYGISVDDYDFSNPLSILEKRRLPLGNVGAYSGSDSFYTFLLNLASSQAGTTLNYLDYIYSAEAHDPAYSGCVRNLTRATVTLMASMVDGSGNVLARSDNLTVTFRLSDFVNYGMMSKTTLRIYWGENKGDGYYYFYHVRYGHGVGLSQRGAEQRAKSGQSYQSILAFYYPGASLSYMNFPVPIDTPNNAKLPTGDFLAAITTGNVNFRKKATASSDKITTIPINCAINVYGSADGWAYAVYDGKAGYVSEDYLKYVSATPTPSASPSAGQVTAYGKVTGSGVNFRTSASSSSSSNIITKLAKNTSLDLYYSTGSWYYASVSGVKGFISTSYVQLTGYPSPNASPTASPSVSPTATAPNLTAVAYGVTNDSVNFRTGPDTSYSIMVELKKGVNVTIYGESGGWYFASAGALTGYLSKGYVNITSNASNTPNAQASPTPTASAAQTVSVGYINTGNTNFRTGPDLSYSIIKALDKNTGLYAYALMGNWYYVLVGSNFGYVHKDYVTITGTAKLGSDGKPTNTVDLSGATGLGKTTGNVNFRSGSGTSFSSYGVLTKGTEVLLFGTENGWYKIKLSDGMTGYVSGKYISIIESYASGSTGGTGGTGSTPGTGTSGSAIGIGVTTGSVYFRTGPSTSDKKIAKLKKGAEVTLYSLSNGWYEVDYNGKRGYLYASYVKVTSNTINNSSNSNSSGTTANTALTLTTGKATGSLNFRSTADLDAKVISTFSAGNTFKILGQSGDWYYVLHNGVTGFVYKAYTSVVSSGTAGILAVGATQTAKNAVTTASVNLRAGAGLSSSVVELLSSGTNATVYLSTGDWYLLNCGGKVGFAVKDYVKVV